MIGLLETVITFVGVVMTLALISQSLIEVLKTIVPLKGMTREASMRMLLSDAARASGLDPADGAAIHDAVARRVAGLGQKGWRGVRLDTLGAKELRDLITEVATADVPGLEGCQDAESYMKRVAEAAFRWYDLAMEPVALRYHRRMTVVNVLGASVIVIALNVDALTLLERARTDPEFRAEVNGQVDQIYALMERADSLEAVALAALAGTSTTPPVTQLPGEVDAMQLRLDSAAVQIARLATESAAILDFGSTRDWRDGRWRAGILITILLVSLGAPFWHDILGSLFGLKEGLRKGPPAASGQDGTT